MEKLTKMERIISGALFIPKEGKTYNNLGDEVSSKNVISKKITSCKPSHKSKKICRTQQKIEALYNNIDKNIQFSENENKRKNSSTKKSNSKKYSRR